MKNPNTLKYLEEHLNKLSFSFPGVTIKLGFDSKIDTYIVELTPYREWSDNIDLLNAWVPISLDFKRRFVNEDISFISNDSILRITDPILVWNK